MSDKWSGFSIGGRGVRVQVTQNGRTFNILKDLDLDELSAVDFPAQSRALAHFAKADITRSKPIVSIGKAATPQETSAMTDAEKKALEDQLAAVKADLAKALTRITDIEKERDAAIHDVGRAIDLSPEHATYAKKLSASERAAFLAKGVGDRSKDIEAARGKEVYKRRDGLVFYENDDPALVEVWKMNDRLAADLEKVSVRETEVVAKADVVKHMGHLAGDDDAKLAIMKAVRGISDEKLRDAAIAVIVKADAHCAVPYTRQGHNLPVTGGAGGGGDVDQTEIEKKVDEIAMEIQKRNPAIAFNKARTEAYRDQRVAALIDEQESAQQNR